MIEKKLIEKFNDSLKTKELTVICAESITAGLISSTIASVSGASSILKGSIVTYDANLKIKILGVDPEIIKNYTAESQETTDAMCRGLRELYPDASLYITITGVASLPTNDYNIDKEVGQIYVTICYKEIFHQFNTVLKSDDSIDQRNDIRDKAVEYVFQTILNIINEDTN